MCRGKFMASKAYARKEEICQVNKLTLQESRTQRVNYVRGRKKEKNDNKWELTKFKKGYQQRRSMNLNVFFFEQINRTYNLQPGKLRKIKERGCKLLTSEMKRYYCKDQRKLER